jgi:hypothetical protein
MKTYTYADENNNSIIVTDDETNVTMTVPTDPGNRDFREIMEQEVEIAPYVTPPIPVSSSVSPLQMRKALRQIGLKAQTDAYITTLDEEEQEAWEYATIIMIDDPFIEGARVALGMSEAQRDDLFKLAASL